MNRRAPIFGWLFEPPSTPSALGSIAWWEIRRVPVNLVIGAYGLVCLIVFLTAVSASGDLQPGEDAVEPAAIFIGLVAFNLCYTLGWLVEMPARLADRGLSPEFGPGLLHAGLLFSLGVVTLPAIAWVVYLCARLAAGVR